MGENDSLAHAAQRVTFWLGDWGGLLKLACVIFTGGGFVWILASAPEVHFRTVVIEIAIPVMTGVMALLAWRIGRQQTLDLQRRQTSTEPAVSEDASRFSSLVEHSLDAISIIKPGGKLLYLSPSVKAIFGYEEAELLGTNLLDRIHPEDRPHCIATIASVCTEAGKSELLEVRAQHRNEEWLNIEAVVTNLISDPHVGGVVINSRNVTERRKAEQALEESEEELRQARKMDAIGKLAGGVAHDFNNLLAVIIGYVDLLAARKNQLDARALQQLEEIRKAADRAASLTRQLLAFSRKQVLQPKILNLNTVVVDVEKMLRRLIGEHIELSTSLCPELGQVKADPGQIEQVLVNLAVNARDALPEGGQIRIETANVYLDAECKTKYRSLESGPHVMIAVTDTGHGMTPEIQSQIFEPFFTTKEKGKGTGLGLSTVYGIVKQSGGGIWVYSEVGRGTTFKVYLPRVDKVAETVTADQLQMLPAPGAGTILLVEDEDSLRSMAREVLTTNGYEVIQARHGTEALMIASEHQGDIELLVTDVIMPCMGGRELAEQLSVLRPDTKVLYISGYTDDSIVHYGVLTEENFFLQKPFTPIGLLHKVHEVLSA